jgi:trimethylamine---corrinoid protein Co-methyltransferase
MKKFKRGEKMYKNNLIRPKFFMLSEEQKKLIHLESIKILSQIGIKITDKEAISLLIKSGCEVVKDNMIKIPEFLVKRALLTAPSQILLYTRDRKTYINLEDNNTYFGTGSDCHYFIDPDTGERRKWTKKDIAAGSRLCDALDNIDFLLSMGIASDIDANIADVHHFEAMLTNTNKPIVFTALGNKNLEKIIEIAEITANDKNTLRQKPNIAIFVESLPPLAITDDTINKVRLMAKEKLPIIYSSGPSLGATGPATIAGCVAMANAEVLGGLVFSQLINEGTPFVYAVGIHPFDMKTTNMGYGAPETNMTTAAAVEMASYYNLPAWGYAGCSDSKLVDQQAAVEATMSVIFSLLSGANLVHDVGYLESGMTTSYEMIALTDYIIEMSKRFLDGIPVDEGEFAYQVIKDIGPAGHFLVHEHTLKNFKRVWYSDLCDRRKYEDWVNKGSKSLGDRLREKVKGIISDYKPEPLPDIKLKQIKQKINTI